jgi:hypothetical protein
MSYRSKKSKILSENNLLILIHTICEGNDCLIILQIFSILLKTNFLVYSINTQCYLIHIKLLLKNIIDKEYYKEYFILL